MNSSRADPLAVRRQGPGSAPSPSRAASRAPPTSAARRLAGVLVAACPPSVLGDRLVYSSARDGLSVEPARGLKGRIAVILGLRPPISFVMSACVMCGYLSELR